MASKYTLEELNKALYPEQAADLDTIAAFADQFKKITGAYQELFANRKERPYRWSELFQTVKVYKTLLDESSKNPALATYVKQFQEQYPVLQEALEIAYRADMLDLKTGERVAGENIQKLEQGIQQSEKARANASAAYEAYTK